jgi:hypothetical protein
MLRRPPSAARPSRSWPRPSLRLPAGSRRVQREKLPGSRQRFTEEWLAVSPLHASERERHARLSDCRRLCYGMPVVDVGRRAQHVQTPVDGTRGFQPHDAVEIVSAPTRTYPLLSAKERLLGPS